MDQRLEVDQLFSVTYDQLRRLAARVNEGPGLTTLNPTALVNEAYLKLAASFSGSVESQLHFKRIAARAMRQVIVETIRRRRAIKRGGNADPVTLSTDFPGVHDDPEDVIAIDALLQEFAKTYPRQAQVVEYRFFAGYDIAETAHLLEVSEATVARDWRFARAWFASQLNATS